MTFISACWRLSCSLQLFGDSSHTISLLNTLIYWGDTNSIECKIPFLLTSLSWWFWFDFKLTLRLLGSFLKPYFRYRFLRVLQLLVSVGVQLLEPPLFTAARHSSASSWKSETPSNGTISWYSSEHKIFSLLSTLSQSIDWRDLHMHCTSSIPRLCPCLYAPYGKVCSCS